jgi:hypothetical protein
MSTITKTFRFLVATGAFLALFQSALPSADSESALAAVVTVHPAKPGLEIPADFLGLSCEKKILSRDCFQPGNAVLAELLRNLGPGVLRVGGNEADRTFWSRNWASPTGSMQENKYSEEPSTLGPGALDNLYAFARLTGWRVVHGVNLADRDPMMAADEAAYAVSAAGDSLLAIEIGNEPNLYNKTAKREGRRPESYGYRQYREECEECVRAVCARLPGAPLAGPATTRICKWFPEFVKDFQAYMALITSHIYPLSAKEENPESPRFASVERLLSARVEPEWVPQLEAAKEAGIPFRLAECNSASGGGKPGVSDAFASALWVVDFCFDVAAHGGAGVNLHGGFTPGNYSPVCYLKKESRYEPAPIYYGMLLFHLAAQGRLVPVECETTANLRVHAALGSDHQLRIVLLNKDLEHPVEAKILLGREIFRAEMIRLSAPSASATAGVTLAGNAVAPDGSWKPGPGEVVQCKNGECVVRLPAASAALLTLQ